MRVLVVNAGSTGLKLAVVDEDDRAEAVASLDDVPADVAAVGHRLVHGGERFREPLILDEDVERQLEELVQLAPLHTTPALGAIRAARTAFPDLPQVAVFDTAYHATIPPRAATYALPRHLRERGVRRFGFHGLSVEWAAEQVRVPRLVVCHLGGGCSVTAVHEGRSVDTTMGFTPLEGVPMTTRSGSVDPGALFYLLRQGVTAPELEGALEHESGLAGLSELSGDMREIEASAEPAARLALDVFVYRVAQAVAAMTVPLGGIDALVFTGGIGEHSAPVRAGICARLGFLGVALDPAANEAARADAHVAARGSRARVVVVRAREDLVVARAARQALSEG
ncbi:MAG TPA: acetate/propionate family kinase [Gaiellaceae bacterium]|nr:acetate/propionate family kinase [Gaiellaceae bacterium]